MKMPSIPRKSVKLTVLRTEDGVMNMHLSPTFWELVAMKQGHKVMAHIIDDLIKEIRSQGPFTFAPLLWEATVDMPMIYGNTYVYVKPLGIETD